VSELDELRGRVSAVESELSRLREENAVTRTVASMADRDVSEFRGALQAHVRTLNALRETQLEQGQTLQTIAQAVGGLAVQVENLTAMVARIAPPGATD
jgi:chromosome segregation ATPase